MLSSALDIQDSWLTRKRNFRTITTSLVVGTVVNSGSRIASGAIVGSSVFGLIAGNLLGMLCRLLLQIRASNKGIRATFRQMGWQKMRQTASQYVDFPKLNAPAAVVFSLGQNLPVLLMGIMFTPAAAGFYAMANRLSQAPITIVANSVRKIFLQKAADINNRGRSLRKAYLLATGGLALLGVVPFICIWLFGQPLLTWLLGGRWFEAGRYLEIMAPWLFMAWLVAPANPVFIVLRKQSYWLTLQSSLTLLRLAAFGVAFAIGAGSEWTLQAFVIMTVIGNLVTIFVAMMLISKTTSGMPGGRSAIFLMDDGGKIERE